MASIGKDKNGLRRLLFIAPDGKRRTIRLGKMPMRHVETIKAKVEQLVASLVSGCSWDNETARWVAELPDPLAGKLARAGLIPKGKNGTPTETLGAFIDAYIESRANLKPNTQRNYQATRKHLVNHFGKDRLVVEITPGDADEWREVLLKTLSPATVSREAKRASQFFRAAERKRLITENPFL